VQQSGGHIWVYSEPGRGTTFKVYLPCADEKAGLAGEEAEEVAFPRGDGTTILVVEDDPIIRALTTQILRDQGYTVVEAEDGVAALEKIASDPTRVNLVLTDVVMRGMSGPELVLRLMRQYPEMKFLYMSGYTGELVVDHGLKEGVALLEKPFTRAGLLKTVQSELRDQ
jgi:CheY-like chemotaxis protein